MTTSYKRLREECNKRLPERKPKCVRCENIVPIQSDFCRDGLAHLIENRPLYITDVLRVLGIHHDTTATVRTNPACLTIRAGRGHVETYTTFDISKPISDPSNAPACEAVLALLDSKKV